MPTIPIIYEGGGPAERASHMLEKFPLNFVVPYQVLVHPAQRAAELTPRYVHETGAQTYFLSDDIRPAPIISEVGDAAILSEINTVLAMGERDDTSATLFMQREGQPTTYAKLSTRSALIYIRLPEPIQTDAGKTILSEHVLAEIKFDYDPDTQIYKYSGMAIVDADAQTATPDKIPIRSIPLKEFKTGDGAQVPLTEAEFIVNPDSRGEHIQSTSMIYVELKPEERTMYGLEHLPGVVIDTAHPDIHLVPLGALSLTKRGQSIKEVAEAMLETRGQMVNVVEGGLERTLLRNIRVLAAVDPRQRTAIPNQESSVAYASVEEFVQEMIGSSNHDLSDHLITIYQKQIQLWQSKFRRTIERNELNAVLQTIPPWLQTIMGSRRDPARAEAQINACAQYFAAHETGNEKRRLLRELALFSQGVAEDAVTSENLAQMEIAFSNEVLADYEEAMQKEKQQRIERGNQFNCGEAELEEKGLGFGELVLEELGIARERIRGIDSTQLDACVQSLMTRRVFREEYLGSPEAVKREMVALILAQQAAEQTVVSLGESKAVNDVPSARIEKVGNPRQKRKTQFGITTDTMTKDSLSLTLGEIFHKPKVASKGAIDWVQLPIGPLLLPRPDRSGLNLASYVWDKVLNSPQLVDKQGREVGMDARTNAAHIQKVANFIDAGIPIALSEYTPLIAIPNPLKRQTQNTAMAEVDFFRRLAQVARSVEMYYPPSVQWHIVNEMPAFTELFGIESTAISDFHDSCQQMVNSINEQMGRQVIILTRMDDYFWSDARKVGDWQNYEQKRRDEMQNALADAKNPEHKSIRDAILTFTYPMATCINPYDCSEAAVLTPAQVIAVYERLKAETGSAIRGVGMGDSSNGEFTSEQNVLFEWLRAKGKELAFSYRLIMGSREVLPAFVTVNDTIKYTMVTKYNKPVLYPNSRRGPSFPAHGEPILFRSDKGWSTVTVRPFVSMFDLRDRYTPWLDPLTGNLLYYTYQE